MCNEFRSTEHVFRPHFCATNYNLSGVMLPTMPHRSTYRRTFSFYLEPSFFTISSFDLFRIYSKALSDCYLCIAFFVFVQPIVNYNFWFVAFFVLNNALWIHLHCLELRDRPSVTAFNLISSLALRSGFMFVFNQWSWCEFPWCHLLIILTRDCFLLCLCVCVRFFSNTDSQWESEQKGGAAGGPATPYTSNGRSSDRAKSSWFGS